MFEENPLDDDAVSSSSSDAVLKNKLEFAGRRLYEYCQKRSMEPPRFVFTKDINRPDHDPSFQATCSVLHHVTTGYGNSKQSAKKSASFSMLMVLNDSVDQPPLTTKSKKKDYNFFSHFRRVNIDEEDDVTSSTTRQSGRAAPRSQSGRAAPRNFREYIARYRR